MIAGSVWSHVAMVGQGVARGALIVICETMKTEIPVEAPVAGTVTWLRSCGDSVEIGDVVAIIDGA